MLKDAIYGTWKFMTFTTKQSNVKGYATISSNMCLILGKITVFTATKLNISDIKRKIIQNQMKTVVDPPKCYYSFNMLIKNENNQSASQLFSTR